MIECYVLLVRSVRSREKMCCLSSLQLLSRLSDPRYRKSVAPLERCNNSCSIFTGRFISFLSRHHSTFRRDPQIQQLGRSVIARFYAGDGVKSWHSSIPGISLLFFRTWETTTHYQSVKINLFVYSAKRIFSALLLVSKKLIWINFLKNYLSNSTSITLCPFHQKRRSLSA